MLLKARKSTKNQLKTGDDSMELEIKVFIDENYFDKPNVDGVALLENNCIVLKELNNSTLIHEIIHILEYNSETKPAIVKLFNETHTSPLKDLMKKPDFLEYVEECYSEYDPTDWESEIYAYHLEDLLCEDFDNNFSEILNFLRWYIKDETDVSFFVFIHYPDLLSGGDSL